MLVVLFGYFVLFESHLRAMNLDVLGYQSRLMMQRCHPACDQEGSFYISPVLASRIFVAMQVQHSYNLPTKS